MDIDVVNSSSEATAKDKCNRRGDGWEIVPGDLNKGMYVFPEEHYEELTFLILASDANLHYLH